MDNSLDRAEKMEGRRSLKTTKQAQQETSRDKRIASCLLEGSPSAHGLTAQKHPVLTGLESLSKLAQPPLCPPSPDPMASLGFQNNLPAHTKI